MYNIQAVCTLQELWNCCASLFVNYYRFDDISVNLMSYSWLSLKMHFISGGAFWKLLLTDENISKHSARQSKLALNILLENSVFSAWIVLEYSLKFYVQNPERTMYYHILLPEASRAVGKYVWIWKFKKRRIDRELLLPSWNCTRYSAAVFYNVNQSIYLITEYFCL